MANFCADLMKNIGSSSSALLLKTNFASVNKLAGVCIFERRVKCKSMQCNANTRVGWLTMRVERRGQTHSRCPGSGMGCQPVPDKLPKLGRATGGMHPWPVGQTPLSLAFHEKEVHTMSKDMIFV